HPSPLASPLFPYTTLFRSCGASGALVAMTWIVHPYLGLPYTVRSFMIVIIAGLGNVSGVLAAALGLGVAENFAGFILGAEYQTADRKSTRLNSSHLGISYA